MSTKIVLPRCADIVYNITLILSDGSYVKNPKIQIGNYNWEEITGPLPMVRLQYPETIITCPENTSYILCNCIYLPNKERKEFCYIDKLVFNNILCSWGGMIMTLKGYKENYIKSLPNCNDFLNKHLRSLREFDMVSYALSSKLPVDIINFIISTYIINEMTSAEYQKGFPLIKLWNINNMGEDDWMGISLDKIKTINTLINTQTK